MIRDLLGRGNVLADDTMFKINLKKLKGKLTRDRFWVYVADDREHGGAGPFIMCIEATENWKMEHPKKILETFTGKLPTDSYPWWLSIKKQSADQFPLQLCWVHACRYFVNVTRKFSGAAKWEIKAARAVLGLIRELSIIESRIHGMSPARKLAVRKEHSAPLVESVRELLAAARLKTEEHSVLARAINYMLENWEFFITFLSYGEVGIHTNIAEQHIKPVADIRKSSGHSLTLEGAESTAILLSLALTCKSNDINPYEWLRDVVKWLPSTPKSERWKQIPYNWAELFGGDGGGQTGSAAGKGSESGGKPDGTADDVDTDAAAAKSSSGNAPDEAVAKNQPAGRGPPAFEAAAEKTHELQSPADGKSEAEAPCDSSVAGSTAAEFVEMEANPHDRTMSTDAAAGTAQDADQIESAMETSTAAAECRPTGTVHPTTPIRRTAKLRKQRSPNRRLKMQTKVLRRTAREKSNPGPVECWHSQSNCGAKPSNSFCLGQ